MPRPYDMPGRGQPFNAAELKRMAREAFAAHNVTASNSGDPADPRIEVVRQGSGTHFRVTKGQTSGSSGFVNGLRLEGCGNYVAALGESSLSGFLLPGGGSYPVQTTGVLIPWSSSEIAFYNTVTKKFDIYDWHDSSASYTNGQTIKQVFFGGHAAGDGFLYDVFVHPGAINAGVTGSWQPVLNYYDRDPANPSASVRTPTTFQFDDKTYNELYVGTVFSGSVGSYPTFCIYNWNRYNKRVIEATGAAANTDKIGVVIGLVSPRDFTNVLGPYASVTTDKTPAIIFAELGITTAMQVTYSPSGGSSLASTLISDVAVYCDNGSIFWAPAGKRISLSQAQPLDVLAKDLTLATSTVVATMTPDVATQGVDFFVFSQLFNNWPNATSYQIQAASPATITGSVANPAFIGGTPSPATFDYTITTGNASDTVQALFVM